MATIDVAAVFQNFAKYLVGSEEVEPGFFAELGRAAAQTENYGGNTREQGYTNMGTGVAFKYLYAYELTGKLADGGEEYLASLDIQELPERVTLADKDWDNAPLDVNDEGTAYLTLGADAGDVLAGIGFSLYYVDPDNNQMMLLGTDNDMTADWDNGIFYDNFRGVWGAIDGHLVYMELSYEGDDYNLYSVPILLNGEEYNLQVAYDFTKKRGLSSVPARDWMTPVWRARNCVSWKKAMRSPRSGSWLPTAEMMILKCTQRKLCYGL